MVYPSSDSSIPQWKIKLGELKSKSVDTPKDFSSQFSYGETEVGLRNPNGESHVKIFDNGNVELFAGDTTGIIISDAYDTINAYGNAVNVNTYNMNMSTRPYGLTWNGYLLNPMLYQLYDEDFQLEGTVRYWVEATSKVPGHWARRSVSIKPLLRCSENDEFTALLQELGIPT